MRPKKDVATTPTLQLSLTAQFIHVLVCEYEDPSFAVDDRECYQSPNSAPMERVFIYAGIMLRSHRLRMRDGLLSDVIYYYVQLIMDIKHIQSYCCEFVFWSSF